MKWFEIQSLAVHHIWLSSSLKFIFIWFFCLSSVVFRILCVNVCVYVCVWFHFEIWPSMWNTNWHTYMVWVTTKRILYEFAFQFKYFTWNSHSCPKMLNNLYFVRMPNELKLDAERNWYEARKREVARPKESVQTNDEQTSERAREWER